jgi:hypothetical protein
MHSLISTSTSLAICAFLFSSCATFQSPKIISSVDSFARTEAVVKKRYVLMPGGKGIEVGDLQFQEFAGYIDKVLAEKGFEKASALEVADIAVFFTYAIGDPQTYQYSYSILMARFTVTAIQVLTQVQLHTLQPMGLLDQQLILPPIRFTEDFCILMLTTLPFTPKKIK